MKTDKNIRPKLTPNLAPSRDSSLTLSQSISVSADVHYLPQESKPEENHFLFSYKVRIQNNSQTPIQLMSRNWVITDGFGQVEEVSGAGVIGLQPRITPGQIFEYDSFCPLQTTSGTMKGRYQMTSDSGERFEVEIPEFYLIAPQALH